MTSVEIVYKLAAHRKKYGNTKGVCCITGKESEGIPYAKWIKETFTDIASLKPGTIVSNEALFCFDESSEIVQKQTGKEKPQRFRTYSHLVANNTWYALTKADKRLMFDIIVNRNPQVVCLSESGQKHLLFKNIPGYWQLESKLMLPNLPLFKHIHKNMCALLDLKFSQAEIISGNYINYRIAKCGLAEWQSYEKELKPYRGNQIFNFAAFLMFNSKNESNE